MIFSLHSLLICSYLYLFGHHLFSYPISTDTYDEISRIFMDGSAIPLDTKRQNLIIVGAALARVKILADWQILITFLMLLEKRQNND